MGYIRLHEFILHTESVVSQVQDELTRQNCLATLHTAESWVTELKAVWKKGISNTNPNQKQIAWPTSLSLCGCPLYYTRTPLKHPFRKQLFFFFLSFGYQCLPWLFLHSEWAKKTSTLKLSMPHQSTLTNKRGSLLGPETVNYVYKGIAETIDKENKSQDSKLTAANSFHTYHFHKYTIFILNLLYW